MESVQIVDIDELMRNKLDECDRFLNGKDAAIGKRDLARAELEKAEAVLAEYDNAEYVETITNYRDGLKQRLGIVDEPEMVSEAEHDDEQDSAPIIVEPVEQPLI